MPRREGAAHVVTTRRVYKGRVYETHLLRRTYRQGGKVKNLTLANLSHLPKHAIELVRGALRGEKFLPAESALKVLSSKSHGHVAAVLGTVRRLGLDELLAKSATPERQRVLGMVVARVLRPEEKLATTRSWKTTTIPEELGLEEADENDLYTALDWLLGEQGRIERALCRRHLGEGELTLYDVTSTYFEGRSCPIAKRSYSRDGKKDKLQVLFGLLSNEEGCPVAVEVFEGDTADPKILPAKVRKLREDFGLSRVTLVGDRGMMTSARIREDLASEEGLDWITALRAPEIQKLREVGTIQLELFDERDLAEVEDPAYPGERLIVCRNPVLRDERRRKRGELLKATERELEKIARSVSSGRLKGRSRIGLRAGKVLGRSKVGKLFRLEIGERSFRFHRREDRIEREAALDGFHVVRTSVSRSRLSASRALRAYKRLTRIERAFRNLKSLGLHVRPPFHWTAERLKAHIFLCMLAYYVQWHMEEAWAPLLFQDDFSEELNARRSPVRPPLRSEAAKWKDSTKRTLDGKPLHSFRTLLSDLGSISRVRVSPVGSGQAAFDILSEPTEDELEALRLLGVRLKP